MSISAISGSYGSSYSYDNSTKKRSSAENPLAAAIGSLKDNNPALATKLQKISDDAAALKKSGASEKEVRESVHQAIDGLGATDKSAVREAMGPPPSGGKGGHGGPPPGPPPSDSSDSDSTSSTKFDLSSYLNSLSSSQNETIVNFLQKLATAAGSQGTATATPASA